MAAVVRQLRHNFVKCVKKLLDSNVSEPGQKYPHMPKISPEVLPLSSINSVHIKCLILDGFIPTK